MAARLAPRLAACAAVAAVAVEVSEPHAPAELPRPNFPGATAAESNGSWPSGRQPARFEAWPQQTQSGGKRTLLPCWKTKVLQDHEDGWPGLCLGLFHAEKVHDQATCRELCLSEARCSVWQFNNQTQPGQCWAGYGTSCADRNGRPDTISVQGAQRVMHGEVRVLKDISGWKVNGLYQLGQLVASNSQNGVELCQQWCYSDISCQYWQYGSGGCWVDSPLLSTDRGIHPERVVQYPLTTDGGATNQGYEAGNMRWGEYIQHYCPPRPEPGEEPEQPASASDIALIPTGADVEPVSMGVAYERGALSTQPASGMGTGTQVLLGLGVLLLAASLGACVCLILAIRKGSAESDDARGGRMQQRQGSKGALAKLHLASRTHLSNELSDLSDGRPLVPIGEEPWLDSERHRQAQDRRLQPLAPGFEDLESRLGQLGALEDMNVTLCEPVLSPDGGAVSASDAWRFAATTAGQGSARGPAPLVPGLDLRAASPSRGVPPATPHMTPRPLGTSVAPPLGTSPMQPPGTRTPTPSKAGLQPPPLLSPRLLHPAFQQMGPVLPPASPAPVTPMPHKPMLHPALGTAALPGAPAPAFGARAAPHAAHGPAAAGTPGAMRMF